MAGLRIIKPGLQTTVQDLGRWGWQSRGVPVAGPMDACSHRLANALVGNARGAAALEIALLGPEIEFEDDREVAVTGAEFQLSVDDSPAPMWSAIHVPAGSKLRFGQRQRGTRAYLAVSGGIATPAVLGSRATHLVSRMGGMQGRAIVGGDRLPLGEVDPDRRPRTLDAKSGASLEPAVHTLARIGKGSARVRVLPGPQSDWFDVSALSSLQSVEYRISVQSDRMGYRLEGPRIECRRVTEMISDVTPFGSLQVPRHGLPILLMADRQTTGGYPKLAIVISADVDIAGQLGPGDAIAFDVCTRDEAIAACAAREQALRAIENQVL